MRDAQFSAGGRSDRVRLPWLFTRHVTLLRVAAIALAVVMLWLLSDVVLLVFFAALLASVLYGAAAWIAARTSVPIRLALALLMICIVVLTAGAVYWIGPNLIQQGRDLLTHLSQEWSVFRQRFGQTPVGHTVIQQVTGAQDLGQHLAMPITKMLSVSLRTVVDIIILIVTTGYFVFAPGLYVAGVLHLVPIPWRPRTLEVMEAVCQTLRFWMLGQLVDMLAVGILSAIGLSIVGVPEPYALAIMSALLTFVPYFGAVVSAIPAIMVALTVSWMTALWTLVIYTVCHCIEGYLIGPLVQRRLIELPPALSVLAMAAAGTVFGSLGIVLGAPLAAAGLVTVRMLYVRDVLGDTAFEAGSETGGRQAPG